MAKQLAAGNRALMDAIENLLDASAEEMKHVKRVVIDISANDVPQVYVHSYVWDNDRLTSLIRELAVPGAADVREVPAPSVSQSESGQLVDEICNIPGGPWFHNAGRDSFIELAVKLTAKGFTDAETLDILRQAYGAVASEYGA